MTFPKLNDVSWGDVISLTAWLSMLIYTVAVLRSDMMIMKTIEADHEVRIRVVESQGSGGLARHIAVDDQRQARTDADIAALQAQMAANRELLVRIDENVKSMMLIRKP